MIADNIIRLHRIYTYKNKTVTVFGFGLSEAGVELVIYKDAFSEEPFVTVGKKIEFLNHATIVENLDDFKRTLQIAQLVIEKKLEEANLSENPI